MKTIFRQMLFALIAAMILCTAASVCAAATEPVITITFDKESVNVGETLTATYEITGEGSYNYINCEWMCWKSEHDAQTYGENFNSDDLRGTLSVIPKFGIALSLHISLEDEDGQFFSKNSVRIPVVGADDTIPPTIMITFDKESVNVGEPLTATYEITGEGSYNYINCEWMCWKSEHDAQTYGENFNSDDLRGTLSIIPKFGTALSFHISVEDSDGQYYHKNSPRIPITNTTGDPPVIYPITPINGSSHYQPGEPLQFRLDVDYSKFRTILIDDQPVPASAYRAWSGSTYVELQPDYLESLSDGAHTLSVLFSDGYADISFSTGRSPAFPRTGDSANLSLWLVLLGLSVSALVRLNRKARHN